MHLTNSNNVSSMSIVSIRSLLLAGECVAGWGCLEVGYEALQPLGPSLSPLRFLASLPTVGAPELGERDNIAESMPGKGRVLTEGGSWAGATLLRTNSVTLPRWM